MKKTISIILATVMLLGALYIAPVNASAPSYYEHYDFTILSPKVNGTYTYGQTIAAKMRPKVFENVYRYNNYNYVCLNFFVNGKEYWQSWSSQHYYESDLGHVLDFGAKNGRTLRFTETGTFEVKIDYNEGRSIGSYKFTVVKAKNPITVKSASKSLTAKAMKKAKKTVKPLTIKKAEGTVKVVKVKKGTSAKIYKKISVNKKNGAVTFKIGTYKKGTYKVKLKIKAAGNKNYKSKSITKTVKIKVK